MPDERRGRLVQISFIPRFDEEDEDLPIEQVFDEGELEDLFQIPDNIDPKTAQIILVVARNRERIDQLMIFLHGTLAAVNTLLLIGISIATRTSIRKDLKRVSNKPQSKHHMVRYSPDY